MKKCDSCGKVIVNDKDYMCPYCGAVASKTCGHSSHLPDDRYNRANDYYSQNRSQKNNNIPNTPEIPKALGDVFGDIKNTIPKSIRDTKNKGKGKTAAIIIAVVFALNALTAVFGFLEESDGFEDVDDFGNDYYSDSYYADEANFDTTISYDVFAITENPEFDFDDDGNLLIKPTEMLFTCTDTKELILAAKNTAADLTVPDYSVPYSEVVSETANTAEKPSDEETTVNIQNEPEVSSENDVTVPFSAIDVFGKSLTDIYDSSTGLCASIAIVYSGTIVDPVFDLSSWAFEYYGYLSDDGIVIEDVAEDVAETKKTLPEEAEMVVIIKSITVSTADYDNNKGFYGNIILPYNCIKINPNFETVTCCKADFSAENIELSVVDSFDNTHFPENFDELATYMY